MAFLTEPAHTPAQMRDNAFTRACAYCGSMVGTDPDGPEGGTAFLLWNERLTKNKWEAVHNDCWSEWERNDYKPLHINGPVAAKGAAAVAAEMAQEATEATLDEALLAILPTAEKLEAMLADAVSAETDEIVRKVTDAFNATVPGMVASLLATARPIAITVNAGPTVTVDRAHKALADIVLMVSAGGSPFLVGPAGSGKTTLAAQVAQCLKRKFYMASRVTSEYKLVGFIDAHGKCVRTQFREAYEHGGVFLFDEVDASDADALTAFNAALAGKLADFPDGMVQRHPDFVAIAAGNTFGRGADRQYVGRNQLDAATLDRFQTYEIDYDEQLESQIAGNPEWTEYVQRVRRAIDAEKVRHVVSPRASIVGAQYLAAGMERAKVEETCVWKGLAATDRARVIGRMGVR